MSERCPRCGADQYHNYGDNGYGGTRIVYRCNSEFWTDCIKYPNGKITESTDCLRNQLASAHARISELERRAEVAERALTQPVTDGMLPEAGISFRTPDEMFAVSYAWAEWIEENGEAAFEALDAGRSDNIIPCPTGRPCAGQPCLCVGCPYFDSCQSVKDCCAECNEPTTTCANWDEWQKERDAGRSEGE